MIELRQYQLDAVNKMKNGCILCGGVGSGKSRTALAYYFKENKGKLNVNDISTPGYATMMQHPKDLYIITTARKRDTHEWEEEMLPFRITTKPELKLYSHEVVIDSWNNIKKYTEVKNAFFIFDEQRVVGYGSWTKSFLKITQWNKWILLSATPGDTWMDYIPVFIANGFYKNKTEFCRRHVVWKPMRNYYQVDRYINTGILIKHRNDILVDMDFCRPAVSHHEDVFVDYDKFAYKDICKNRWDPWNNEPIQNASGFCYALRHVVNTSDSRQLALLEIAEKHPKIIIFYNFDYELEILKMLAEGGGFTYAQWNGHYHQDIPDCERWWYLVQYTAGAEGWNCIKTDTIIFFSQNYSYKTMTQASGRIDRLNTPFTDLYYYHLKSHSGIDLAISKALKSKKKFNETGFYSKF